MSQRVCGTPQAPPTRLPGVANQPVAPPGDTNQPAWTSQLQMPGQSTTAPEIASPVPRLPAVDAPPMIAPAPGMKVAPPKSVPPPRELTTTAAVLDEQVEQPTVPFVRPETLPAVPGQPVTASKKCITEGCNCKPKDRGMCARCLKDTLAYMEKDPKITWEFLEANGLALPASGSGAGGKFLAGLTAKLRILHEGVRQDS